MKKIRYGKQFGSILLTLCMALTLLCGSIGTSAETTEVDEKLFASYPPLECFDELWVGDLITFECMCYYDGGETYDCYPGSEVTVLSGADCLKDSYIYYGTGDYAKALECIQPGKATIKVKAVDKNGNSAERTYTLTFIERPADKPVKVTTTFTGSTQQKIGTDFRALLAVLEFQYENLNYGSAPERWYGGSAYPESVHAGCWVIDRDCRFFNYGWYGGFSFHAVGTDRSWSLHGPDYFGPAIAPGTLTLQPGYRGNAISDAITFVVEEPIITTNAPGSVTIGDTLNLTTALTNLNVTNKQVSDYEEALAHDTDPAYQLPKDVVEKYRDGYDTDDAYFAYQPTVEILQGGDCVAQSDQDYSNTLSTSETLTFQKAGTVKLKITYHQINTNGWSLVNGGWDSETETYIYKDTRYNPELIVTIRVKYPDQPEDGDLNGNDKIDATDYMLLKRFVLGTKDLTELQQAAADVNGDNKVNAADYMLIKRAVLGTYTIG